MNLYQDIFNLLLSEQLHKLGTYDDPRFKPKGPVKYYDDPSLKPKGPVKPRPPTEEDIGRKIKSLPKRLRPKSV
jgi:hypothetical protein